LRVEYGLSATQVLLTSESPESPHFIETLPRRGYRFIAPVESAGIGKLSVEALNNGVPKQASKRPWTLRLAILFGGCVLLLGAGFYLYKLSKVSEPPGQRTFTRVTFDDGLQNEPTWSPDGRYIAYSSDYIAYRSEEGEGGINVVPALGGLGLERKIASFGYYPHLVTRWLPSVVFRIILL
jgi:hypothetical protein